MPQPIERPRLLSVVDGLKYPFHQFGRAFEKGLVKVERDHALERVGDLQQRLLAKGYQLLVGGLGPGAGFAFGVTVFRENLRGTRARLDLPLQYSTNGYASLGASLAIPLAHDAGLVVKPDFEFQRRPPEGSSGCWRSCSTSRRSTRRTSGSAVSGRISRQTRSSCSMRCCRPPPQDRAAARR